MIGRARSRDDPPAITATAVLYGGLLDGSDVPVQRPVGASPPHELPGQPGYFLAGQLLGRTSEAWTYAWQHPHTGHRRECSKASCEPGCPAGRPLTPRPISP